MLQETLDGSKADLSETNDPAFPRTKINGSSFDASAGVYYHHKRWYAGFGFLHLTSPVVRLGETNQYHVKPQYNFTAGYNIKIPQSVSCYSAVSVIALQQCRFSG